MSVSPEQERIAEIGPNIRFDLVPCDACDGRRFACVVRGEVRPAACVACDYIRLVENGDSAECACFPGVEELTQEHHEPAPSVAADSPNQAGVETPTRGDLLKADCNERDETVSGVPEAGVDVSSSGTPHLSDKVHVRCLNCGSYELRVERAIEVARS